ncbi:EsaB/YukD family protein [Frankia sp. Mgl5]|uniref:EsaB/YukD family protein n=1 Tax=Frankia sp. Mgl5 TaxID=2933793 RepID=UPI002010443A|nr:EsaB/YukD family protein [Frankia sp. Mgl5]MCK9925938.1 EsaB/YukD family protein [Frankia sp. Mgl5]
MADVPMTLIQPSGTTTGVEMPDDVPIGELIPEFVTELGLPTTGSDGSAVVYKIHSKSLGRELTGNETLSDAGVPADSPLVIAPFVVAGASAATGAFAAWH